MLRCGLFVERILRSSPTRRSFSTQSNVAQAWNCFTVLRNRGVLEIRGPDTEAFLHGLCSVDVRDAPQENSLLYTAFLNATGRVLADAFIYPGHTDANDTSAEASAWRLECDRSLLASIASHLKKYRLRSKVDISDVSDAFSVYAVMGSGVSNGRALSEKWFPPQTAWQDPRLDTLGLRALVPSSVATPINIGAGFKETGPWVHTILRIENGLPEGPDDLPSGDCFPLESNIDLANGVSYTKGCYLGQELTARTHHRGVVRKRLMPIRVVGSEPLLQNPDVYKLDRSVNSLAPVGSPVLLDGKAIGRLGSSVESVGLALLRLEEVLDGERKGHVLEVGGKQVVANIPSWWDPSVYQTE
mmetsp:Transcript_43329/g.70316  ORF Transcript_43329/g.70316 Transcript_43329/m.70316 type:complete len:358 (+) Transcript_43329:29-1102(+)